MNQIRVVLLATVVGLVLFASLCLFTVAPYEHVLVESFGQQVRPIQIFGDPPDWLVMSLDPRRQLVEPQSGRPLRVMTRLTADEMAKIKTEAENSKLSFEVEVVDGSELALLRDQDRNILLTAKPMSLGPGLYLKFPTPINRVRRFSNRLNIFKEKLSEISTASAEPIMIQPYLLWQIADPQRFWTSVSGDESQIEEKIEARLRGVMSDLIGRNYRIEDFYSLDQIKARELRNLEEQRMLYVVASKEVEDSIHSEVQTYQDKRLLGNGRISLAQYEELDNNKTVPADTPELAELAWLEKSHFTRWREAMLQRSRSADKASVDKINDLIRIANDDTERLAYYLTDQLKRERKINDASLATLRVFARRCAAEQLLMEAAEDLNQSVFQAYQSLTASSPKDNPAETDVAWQKFWDSDRVRASRERFSAAVAELEGFLSSRHGWKPTQIESLRSAVALQVQGMLAAVQAIRELNLEESASRNLPTGQLQQQSQQLANFAKLNPRLATGFAKDIAAGKIETVDALSESLFQTLTMTEGLFQTNEADIREKLEKSTSAEERRSLSLTLAMLAKSRSDQEARLRRQFGEALPTGAADRIAEAARRWAAARVRARLEALAYRRKLEDTRGYPRETVEQIRSSIKALEAQLAQTSLTANNTVKIAQMEAQIRDLLNSEMSREFGIAIREVGFRRLSFPPTASASVYSRMKTERIRIAETIKAMGELDKSRILTDAERRKRDMLAEAEADAKKIIGAGQSEATKIQSEVVADARDAELYRLMVQLNTLEKMLNKPSTTLVIQAGEDNIFRVLYSDRAPTTEELKRLGAKVPAMLDAMNKAGTEIRPPMDSPQDPPRETPKLPPPPPPGGIPAAGMAPTPEALPKP